MIKRILLTIVTLTFVFTLIGVSMAGDKGNGRKGKYLFRKNCRSCHTEGADAKELSPVSKTQAQWDKAFAADQYKEFSCAAEWEKRSEKELLDIYTYMYDHAFDSPSPAKCK